MDLSMLTWDPLRGWSEPLPAPGSGDSLVLVFGGSVQAEQRRPLRDLTEAYPTSVMLGCSTSGQIMGAGLRDDAWVVSVATFENIRLRKAEADISGESGSLNAGRAIGKQLAGPDLRGVMVLSEGLNVNGSELVRGILAELGPDVMVTGGLAGDGDRFERTWVVDGQELRSQRVVAVGFYGEHVRMGSGSQGGWAIFGPERMVTRSSGNVLYELDGHPALGLYKRYLGDLASELPASALLFPLAIRASSDAEQLVRTVLSIDEADQSMTFAGDVPEGCQAQLMRSSADRLVDGAASAAAMSCRDMRPGCPSLSVAISCVGRRLVLGERTDEELEAAVNSLFSGSRLIGFYSYGEIAPSLEGASDLHNQTMTVTTIAEE
jgi:hypothetical protein